MKFISVFLNVAMFTFTSFVLVEEGFSKEAGYILLTLLLLIVPVLNLVMILRGGGEEEWADFRMKKINTGQLKSSDADFVKIAIMIINIFMIGYSFWAIIRQGPRQTDNGLLSYIIIILSAPVFTLVYLVFYKK